jgi:hypothetical protein
MSVLAPGRGLILTANARYDLDDAMPGCSDAGHGSRGNGVRDVQAI